MNALTDALLILFLALGSAWFAVDLVRKLRAPAASPVSAPVVAPAPLVAPAPVPVAPAPVVVAPAPVSVAAPAPAPAPEPVEDCAPASHLAVIAAAVHHVFQGRARLSAVMPAEVAIAGHGVAHAAPIDWAREGRRDIFVSHRVR